MDDTPFETCSITGPIRRFPGAGGWHHLLLPPELDQRLRPLVTAHWPALLKVAARVDAIAWTATVMPIKDGPLFIDLPAKIRKQLDIEEGDEVTVRLGALPRT